MDTKKCLACGREMAADLDECPQCRLAGQNQLFFSKEDFKKWEEQVVVPHRKRLLPKVFAGPDRMLILLGNGNLYAMGSAKSGALGERFNEYLYSPALIAQGVRHVAAAEHLTLLVMNDGTTRMLGNSQLADRFVCKMPVEKAYTAVFYGGTTFRLLGENGQWYFAGRNGGRQRREQTLLRELPDIAVSWEQTKEWYTVTPPSTTESPYRSVYAKSRLEYPENSPEFKALCEQVRREEWYRDYVREYGEGNVEIRLTEPVKTEMVECHPVDEKPTTLFSDSQVFERADMLSYYTPQVVKVNENIFEAAPYEEKNKTPHVFENCESQTMLEDELFGRSGVIGPKEKELRKKAILKALDIHVPYRWYFRRGLFEGFREDSVDDCRAYLDAKNRFH
ncbi:MAG: hypothetical protein IJE08_00085, partial [Clostridia bacterium]|nr:hypothetical protein [Clostridia bacterium]